MGEGLRVPRIVKQVIDEKYRSSKIGEVACITLQDSEYEYYASFVTGNVYLRCLSDKEGKWHLTEDGVGP